MQRSPDLLHCPSKHRKSQYFRRTVVVMRTINFGLSILLGDHTHKYNSEGQKRLYRGASSCSAYGGEPWKQPWEQSPWGGWDSPGAFTRSTEEYLMTLVAIDGPEEQVCAQLHGGEEPMAAGAHVWQLKPLGDQAGTSNRWKGPKRVSCLFCYPLHLKDGDLTDSIAGRGVCLRP